MGLPCREDWGNIGGIVDVNLTAPVGETPRIQEAHGTIMHIVCDLVEKELFSAVKGAE